MLFALSQVEFFLAMFILALISNQNVHAGYIKALERKINHMCGEFLSCWELEATAKFLFHRRGSFLWINAVIIVVATIVAGLAIHSAYDMINNMLTGILLALELIAMVVLSVATAFDAPRVEAMIASQMDV